MLCVCLIYLSKLRENKPFEFLANASVDFVEKISDEEECWRRASGELKIQGVKSVKFLVEITNG